MVGSRGKADNLSRGRSQNMGPMGTSGWASMAGSTSGTSGFLVALAVVTPAVGACGTMMQALIGTAGRAILREVIKFSMHNNR